MQRGEDSQGAWVWIDRIQGTRTSAWKLYRVNGEWRAFKVLFSKENVGLNNTPERVKTYEHHEACRCHARGIRLRGNRLDRTLIALANATYA